MRHLVLLPFSVLALAACGSNKHVPQILHVEIRGMKSLGIHGEFGQSAYLAEQLYERHGLTGPKMAEAAARLIG